MATLSHRQPPRTPFHTTGAATPAQPIPSSSPAFATPQHPLRPVQPHTTTYRPHLDLQPSTTTTLQPPPAQQQTPPPLPILLPPATLRPLAFRTFTKKHSLTLTTSALTLLASFIGRHCGAGWREDGLAEPVLEEVARMWKRGGIGVGGDTAGRGGGPGGGMGDVIVDGDSPALKAILKQLEGCMSGGRIVIARGGGTLSRQVSLVGGGSDGLGLQRQESFGVGGGGLEIEEDEDGSTGETHDARRWLKVVDAFEQPRMVYNPVKKHFERSKTTPTIFPPPTLKTDLFRQRYHILHQRVLRATPFQLSSSSTTPLKITSINSLLGRPSTSHLLLGLLTISPTGTLTLGDPTGAIALDLSHASHLDTSLARHGAEPWLVPGMMLLVDGIYEEEFNSAGGSAVLGGMGGIGGTIGGRFIGLSVGAPRCETRADTLGITTTTTRGGMGASELHVGGGFGWVDFLGVGSERGVGARMRKIERRLLRQHARDNEDLLDDANLQPSSSPAPQPPTSRAPSHSNKLVILGEVNLDNPATLSALRKVLQTYVTPSIAPPHQTPPPPISFILLGSFVSRAAMSATTTSHSPAHGASIPDSMTYKEHFDALALLLSDFPSLLRNSTWVFVPGDNDPWPAGVAAGSAVPLPRGGVPELFTSRVRRAFAAANAEVRGDAGRVPGEAVWTTNPSRVTLFGPNHEVVLFRDDVSGRLRRNAISLKNGGADEERREEGMEDVEGHGTSEAVAMVEGEPQDLEAETTEGIDADGATQAMELDGPATTKSNRTTSSSAPPGPTPVAQALTKALLDQSHLSPFPLTLRPQHWSYAHTLSLYPLPTALVLCDAEADPFACVYQGCCVVNAGRLVGGPFGGGGGGKKAKERGVRWVEVDVCAGRGLVRSLE